MAPHHKPQLLFDVLVFMGEESLVGWALLRLHHHHQRHLLLPSTQLASDFHIPKVRLSSPSRNDVDLSVCERDCTCKSFTE